MIYISTFSAFIKSSSLLCILGLAIGGVLLREEQRLVGTNATAVVSIATPFYSIFAVNFKIRQAMDDKKTNYGFQSTAIAQSLPQALFAWALLLLAAQGLWMTFSDLPLTRFLATLLPLAALLVLAFVSIRNAVYPRQKFLKDSALLAIIAL